ncbi:MAG: GNAT family N-acetyltransferase [Rhizobiaceae bacterium]
MRVEFRPALASDADALDALERAAFTADRISRASFRRLAVSRSAAVVIARTRHGLEGYFVLLFRSGSRVARLYSIAVRPGRTGAGIGGQLLGEARSESIRRGAAELRLEVRPDNRAAIALYERAGFFVTGRRDRYYADGSAALTMALRLTAPRSGRIAETVSGTVR